MGRAAAVDRGAQGRLHARAGSLARILPRQDAGLVDPRPGGNRRQHSPWRDREDSQDRTAPDLCHAWYLKRLTAPWPVLEDHRQRDQAEGDQPGQEIEWFGLVGGMLEGQGHAAKAFDQERRPEEKEEAVAGG